MSYARLENMVQKSEDPLKWKHVAIVHQVDMDPHSGRMMFPLDVMECVHRENIQLQVDIQMKLQPVPTIVQLGAMVILLVEIHQTLLVFMI